MTGMSQPDHAVLLAADVEIAALDFLDSPRMAHHGGVHRRHLAEGIGAPVESVAAVGPTLAVTGWASPGAVHADIRGRLGQEADQEIDP